VENLGREDGLECVCIDAVGKDAVLELEFVGRLGGGGNACCHLMIEIVLVLRLYHAVKQLGTDWTVDNLIVDSCHVLGLLETKLGSCTVMAFE
jgi:hypothetical protein